MNSLKLSRFMNTIILLGLIAPTAAFGQESVSKRVAERTRQAAHQLNQSSKQAVTRIMKIIDTGKNATTRKLDSERKIVINGVKAAKKRFKGKPLTKKEKKSLRELEIRAGGAAALLLIIAGTALGGHYLIKKYKENNNSCNENLPLTEQQKQRQEAELNRLKQQKQEKEKKEQEEQKRLEQDRIKRNEREQQQKKEEQERQSELRKRKEKLEQEEQDRLRRSHEDRERREQAEKQRQEDEQKRREAVQPKQPVTIKGPPLEPESIHLITKSKVKRITKGTAEIKSVPKTQKRKNQTIKEEEIKIKKGPIIKEVVKKGSAKAIKVKRDSSSKSNDDKKNTATKNNNSGGISQKEIENKKKKFNLYKPKQKQNTPPNPLANNANVNKMLEQVAQNSKVSNNESNLNASGWGLASMQQGQEIQDFARKEDTLPNNQTQNNHNNSSPTIQKASDKKTVSLNVQPIPLGNSALNQLTNRRKVMDSTMDQSSLIDSSIYDASRKTANAKQNQNTVHENNSNNQTSNSILISQNEHPGANLNFGSEDNDNLLNEDNEVDDFEMVD